MDPGPADPTQYLRWRVGVLHHMVSGGHGQHWHVADVTGGKLGGTDLQAALDRQEELIEELLGR